MWSRPMIDPHPALTKRLVDAARRMKTCFVPVPLSEVEHMPDPDYGFDVVIDPRGPCVPDPVHAEWCNLGPTTHTDHAGVERCDLCGHPVPPTDPFPSSEEVDFAVISTLRADLAAMTSSCEVQQIALEHLREHVRIAAERVVTLTRELQIERDEIRPTAEELTHREVERQLQAKIVTLTQRAEEAEATITCEQQQRLAYSRYISELEARVQTAEQERDELKTDKAFWELMTRDDRVTALEDELSTLLAARDRLGAQWGFEDEHFSRS